MTPTLRCFNLEGKTAVVTGCRRGIGLAMAQALASAGADIVGVSAQLECRGSDAERVVSGLGRSFTPITCDLADPVQVRGVAERLTMEHRVDILVNNAGVTARAPAEFYTDADWARILQIDLSAQFVLTREIGRSMLDRGRGKIIFTASMLSFQGGINLVAYTAAKSGLAGLTRAFANEWAGRGITVNAIAPGYIDTDITQPLRDDPERSAAILHRIPMGRWGRPDDIRGAVIFLASAASDYVTGVVLPVDGGWMSR